MPEEIPLVLAAAHRPVLAAHVLSTLMRSGEAQGALTPPARLALEQDISTLSQALGACEKILRNPISLSYTR